MPRRFRKNVSTAAALVAAVFVLNGCTQSSVGGQVEFGAIDGRDYSKIIGYCDGQCKDFDEFQRCVQFSSGIQKVCRDHFISMAEVNATRGDCSPIIRETSGNVYLNYEGC